MSDLTPITREEALLDGQDLTPITRQEMFIKHIYDASQEIPTPITREEWFLKKAAESGGGGDITVVPLSVTNNGTYTAPTGKAYSPVSVSVPLPPNAHLATPISSQPITDASDYPLPKCDVTVTNADKCEVIVTDDGIITEDGVPYNYRQSAGGDTELDELVGGTVAWNQMIDKSEFPASSGIFTNNGDGSVTANGTPTETVSYATKTFAASELSVGHKYIGFSDFVSDGSSSTFELMLTRVLSGGANLHIYSSSRIFVCEESTQEHIYQFVVRANTIVNIKCTPQLFDLTLMFGSTIADYIYSLEQSTAGAGVVWLKEHFPKLFDDGYKAYNAGELVSVKTSAHVMKDSNDVVIGSYPLSPVELRGLFKLGANNKLYCDGDSYRCDGRVQRRYGIVDLGTLSWTYASDGLFHTRDIKDCKNFISAMYMAINNPAIIDNTSANVYLSNLEGSPRYRTNDRLYFKNTAYTDTNTFKTAMSGVMLVYELETPTEEQTSPFEKNQAVDAGGTEEYIDERSVSVPVGHSTKYYNGKAYTKYFAQKSGVVEMADEGIMPMTPMYISANGEIDAEYWK